MTATFFHGNEMVAAVLGADETDIALGVRELAQDFLDAGERVSYILIEDCGETLKRMSLGQALGRAEPWRGLA